MPCCPEVYANFPHWFHKKWQALDLPLLMWILPFGPRSEAKNKTENTLGNLKNMLDTSFFVSVWLLAIRKVPFKG